MLGLEVVLPEGSIWSGLRRVQKDKGGYQLRKLFCGAEGTLGIVTKAVLKLVPEPTQEVTALLAVRHMDAGCQLATLCRSQAGEFLSAMEFFSDFGLELALAKVPNLTFPLESRAPFYLLLEAGAGSSLVPLKKIVSAIIEQAMAEGLVSDGVVAASETQRRQLWRLREEQPEGQRLSGPQLKHDISVPPGLMSEFLRCADKLCQEILPGIRANAFGHLGDGNVHYNLSRPVGRDEFSDLELAFALQLWRLTTEMNGSFAAEHGLGRAKVTLADQLREPLERSFMAQLKTAIDSAGTLNPGVIVTTPT